MIASGLMTYLVHFLIGRALWRVLLPVGVPAIAASLAVGLLWRYFRRTGRKGRI